MAHANDKIQLIRERIDIVRVIGARVELKKKGQRYLGLCPFHAEKTPSFSVSPEKGLFYCFGCHAGGDAFAFLMKHEGLGFYDAAARLGAEVGVPLAPESTARAAARREEDELVRVNAYACAYFQHQLFAKGGARCLAYLRGRGLDDEVLRQWRIGYDAGARGLIEYLDKKRVPRALAAKAGLLTDDMERSLFVGRAVFPVCDGLGRLAGFGGRRLEEGEGPKYINTREGRLFAKRHLLFGLEHAEAAIRRSKRVVVVEGYMDVIACHAAGLKNTVAALGTAFTEDHARECARLAREAVVLLDADAAGRAASFKAARRLLTHKVAAAVAVLDEGADPDTYLRAHGAEALRARVETARPAVEHFMELSFAGAALGIEEKAARARELWPLIVALGPGLERDLYTSRLAERVGVLAPELSRHMNASLPKAKPEAPVAAEPSSSDAAPAVDAQELRILQHLLLYPELRPRLGQLAEYAFAAVSRQILEDLATTSEDPATIIERHAGGNEKVLQLALVRPETDPAEQDLRAEKTFDDILRHLKARHVDVAWRDVLRELRDAEAKGVDTSELIRRQRDLSRRRQALLHPRQKRERG